MSVLRCFVTNSKNLEEIGSRFGIAQYQIAAISELLQRTSIAGKRVLEVGGSNLPREFVIGELGAREWVSVDIIAEGRYQLLQQSDHYSREGINSFEEGRSLIGTKPYIIIDGQIESAAPLPSAYFDLIVSITSFEHILAVASAIRQIRRLKTRDGAFFTYHGPIWSSYCGHHIWVDDELNFNVDDAIPEFGHLLYSPPEMYHRLMSGMGMNELSAQFYKCITSLE